MEHMPMIFETDEKRFEFIEKNCVKEIKDDVACCEYNYDCCRCWILNADLRVKNKENP